MLSTKKRSFDDLGYDECLPRGVRRVYGSPHLYQLRICPLAKQVVNFGIYHSAYEAGRVGRIVRSELGKGVDLWTVLLRLIEAGDVPSRVATKWIYPVDGGWSVRARNRRGEVHLPGPYKTMRAARKAAKSHVVPR